MSFTYNQKFYLKMYFQQVPDSTVIRKKYQRIVSAKKLLIKWSKRYWYWHQYMKQLAYAPTRLSIR